ncbi:hypothetical protein Tco_1292937 [Tanacetum coccineum]
MSKSPESNNHKRLYWRRWSASGEVEKKRYNGYGTVGVGIRHFQKQFTQLGQGIFVMKYNSENIAELNGISPRFLRSSFPHQNGVCRSERIASIRMRRTMLI